MGMCNCTDSSSERATANLDTSLRFSLETKVHAKTEETKGGVFCREDRVAELADRPQQYSLPLSPGSVSFHDVSKLEEPPRPETVKGTEADTPINTEMRHDDLLAEELCSRTFVLGRLTPASREVYESLHPFYYLGQASLQSLTVLSSGAIYFGETNSGQLPHGFGLRVDTDATLLEGMWENGSLHGVGMHLYPNGDYYEGEFRSGEIEGQGCFIRVCGASYEGEWKDSRQCGLGIETWVDGSVYTGQFVAGKKHGKGHFKWANGASYEGDFYCNQLEGMGKYVWADARVYEGEWTRNRMHGRGKFVWPDGRVYEGDFVEDKRQGNGTFRWQDGKTYTGAWRMNNMHGLGVLTDRDGLSASGEWRDGVLITSSP